MKKPRPSTPLLLLPFLLVFHAEGSERGGATTPRVATLTSAWTRVASFAARPTRGAVAFTVAGAAYVVAGMGDSDVPNRECWKYDPGTNRWTRKNDFPGAAVIEGVGFSIGEKGYVCLGNTNGPASAGKDLWEYDPVTDLWTKKAPFPGIERSGSAAVVIGEMGYVFAGNGTNESGGWTFAPLRDLWEYDARRDTWTRKADCPGDPRFMPSAFTVSGKGYFGLGRIPGSGFSLARDLWEYDPLTNAWTRRADLPGEARAYAIGLALGTRGYIAFGLLNGNPLALLRDVWEFDPGSNHWTRLDDFADAARAMANGFVLGSDLYLGLGNDTTGRNLSDFWRMRPTQAPATPVKWVVPTAASAQGIGGSRWRTDLWLTNAGQEPIRYDLYLPDGTPGESVASVTVPAGEGVALHDVLGATLGRPGTSAMIGIDVASGDRGAAVLSSGTYNLQPDGGVSGSAVPVVPPAEFLGAGSRSYAPLSHLPGDAGATYRSSLGAVSGEHGATVDFLLLDVPGSQRGLISRTLPPWTRLQELASTFFGTELPPDAHVEAVIRAGTLAWYTTMADNQTNSPVFNLGTLAMPSRSTFHGLANASGAGGTLWQTDMTFTNTATSPRSVTLRFLARDAEDAALSGPLSSFTLAGGETTTKENVVDGLWGLSRTAGAATVESADSSIVVSGRTFNRGEAGTYGVALTRDFDNGARSDDASVIDRVANGLVQNETTRTNVGYENLDDLAADVTLTYTGPDGRVLAIATDQLPPHTNRQVSSPLASFAPIENASVRLHVAPSPSGVVSPRVALHVYPVNNVTGQGFNQTGMPIVHALAH